jgi:hypothetical protein
MTPQFEEKSTSATQFMPYSRQPKPLEQLLSDISEILCVSLLRE